jgi:hypothetical protein
MMEGSGSRSVSLTTEAQNLTDPDPEHWYLHLCKFDLAKIFKVLVGTVPGTVLCQLSCTYSYDCELLGIRIRIHMFLGLPDPHPDSLVTSKDTAPDPYSSDDYIW